MLISEPYRALNAQLHEREGDYGTSGEKWGRYVVDMALWLRAGTILDYGCGKGTLKAKIDRLVLDGEAGEGSPRQFEVLEYDPAVPGKTTKPASADIVVCGDVLEHVEPNCLDAVLDDIRDIAQKAVLLIVATEPAKKTLPDGRNTHLLVHSPEWWLPRLEARWIQRTYAGLGSAFLFVGQPI